MNYKGGQWVGEKRDLTKRIYNRFWSSQNPGYFAQKQSETRIRSLVNYIRSHSTQEGVVRLTKYLNRIKNGTRNKPL